MTCRLTWTLTKIIFPIGTVLKRVSNTKSLFKKCSRYNFHISSIALYSEIYNLNLKDQTFISVSKRGSKSNVSFWHHPHWPFCLVYGTVPVTYWHFWNIYLKVLDISFPVKQLIFGHLGADIWPFEKKNKHIGTSFHKIIWMWDSMGNSSSWDCSQNILGEVCKEIFSPTYLVL